jgi:hypothetical protein
MNNLCILHPAFTDLPVEWHEELCESDRRSRRVPMVAIFIAALCVIGVAFYLKFLAALCKDYRSCGIWYLVRLRGHASEAEIVAVPKAERSLTRAA